MRYGSVLILIAVSCTGLSLAVRAQVHSTIPACPPGRAAVGVRMTDGTIKWGCGPASFAPGMAGSPPPVGVALSCQQDSDCPGDTRCQWGTCGRTNWVCNAD